MRMSPVFYLRMIAPSYWNHLGRVRECSLVREDVLLGQALMFKNRMIFLISFLCPVPMDQIVSS